MLMTYPKIIQDCPSFGIGYSPDERACKECEAVSDCQPKTEKIQNKKIKRKERKMETAKPTPKSKKEKVEKSPKTEMEVVEKKVKEAKPKPEKKPISQWGHRLDRQSGQIDLLVAKGTYTREQMAKELSLAEDRIKGHLKHLEKDKGLKLIYEESGVIKVA